MLHTTRSSRTATRHTAEKFLKWLLGYALCNCFSTRRPNHRRLDLRASQCDYGLRLRRSARQPFQIPVCYRPALRQHQEKIAGRRRSSPRRHSKESASARAGGPRALLEQVYLTFSGATCPNLATATTSRVIQAFKRMRTRCFKLD